MSGGADIVWQMAELGTYSLKRRIVAAVLIAVCGVWLLLGFAIHRAVLRTSAVELDERLMQQGRVILAYAEHEYAETHSVVASDAVSGGAQETPDVVYQIRTSDNSLIYRSAGAPAEPIAPVRVTGFSDVTLPTGTWRAYSVHSASGALIVQIAEPAGHRALIAARVRTALMIPVVLGLPLLALLVYWMTKIAFRSVEHLTTAIAARDAGDLSPLDTGRMPTETKALGAALNTLIKRQGEALERESRFTGDAAHELRTPLAAVRTQAQVALRATTPTESRWALVQLMKGVDRANRLVTQLLALARIERGSLGTASTERSLSAVISSVVHDLEPLAESTRVAIEVGPLPELAAPEEPIYLLLRNLLDNALRHSPPDSIVRLSCTLAGSWLTIEVRDQGPGIPPALRQRIFERFYRGTQSYDGSGLGLSIVRRVVEILHGTLRFSNLDPGPGLCVNVDVPAPVRVADLPAPAQVESEIANGPSGSQPRRTGSAAGGG
jgi:two-component system, OmpR family, sensor histidine kinase QseC